MPEVRPGTDPEPRGLRRDAFRVFLFFLCAFWLTNSGFDSSEAGYHYRVARLFVETGRIGFVEPQDGIFTQAPDGRWYASHEFGNSLFLIPTAALNRGLGLVLGRVGVSPDRIALVEGFLFAFQAGIYGALILALLFLILTRHYGQTRRAAFLGCLAVGFGTFFWPYSRNLFDGVLAGVLLIGALAALLRFRERGSLPAVALAFALLGTAVDTRLSMVVPTMAALGFVVASGSSRRWQALAVALLVLAPFAVWQMGYNHLRTGNPLISPVQTDQYAKSNALDGDLTTGLVGLLVSPGKGLLIYAPLLLVSASAFPRFWRRDRAVATFVLATAVLWLLLHARLRSWYGAWGWGPRHMITLLPMLSLPALVHLPELWGRARTRALLVATLAAGFVLAAAAIVGNWQYRMELALRDDRLGDAVFVWGLPYNQAVDMVGAAGRNLAVVAGALPPLHIAEASELNNYASNRINVWWFTLPRSGVPLPVVLSACLPLIFGLVWTGRRLLRDPNTSEQGPPDNLGPGRSDTVRPQVLDTA